jgi:hypothetical protein
VNADAAGRGEDIVPLAEAVVDLPGLEVLEPKLVRIQPGGVGELVDELLGREAGLRAVRCPHGRGLEERVPDENVRPEMLPRSSIPPARSARRAGA